MARAPTPEPGARGLLVGELAAALGVTRKTLRHYEKLGVVPPAGRTAKGYRLYPAAAVVPARLAVGLRALGFPLETVRDLLAASRDGAALRAALMAVLDQRIRQAMLQIAILQGRRDEMEARLLALFDLPAAATSALVCDAFLGPGSPTSDPPEARAALKESLTLP